MTIRAEDQTGSELHWSYAGALAVCFGCMLVLVVRRGLWFDEFWTIFLSRHDAPIGVLFQTRWGPDVHPPLYTFFTWALEPLTGNSKLAMRMTNLAGIAGLAAVLLALRRRLGPPGFLPLFLLLLSTSPFFVTYFAEYRSYFLEICATAAVILALIAGVLLDRDLSWSNDREITAITFFAILIGGNLHFTSGAAVLIYAGIALLYHGWRRHWRMAKLIFVAVALTTATLFGALAIAIHFDPPPTPNSTSFGRGAIIVAGVIGLTLFGNGAAAWFAWREWRDTAPGGPAWRLPLFPLLAAMIVAAALTFVVLNGLSPFLTPRYVTALIPPTAALIAWSARDAARRSGSAPTLIAGNAALIALAVTVQQADNRRWETFVPAIRAVVRACPETRVLALYSPLLGPSFSDDAPTAVENNHEVFIRGYRFLANLNGFSVIEAPDPAHRLIATAAHCPTLVWVEHNVLAPGSDRAHLLATGRIAVDPARQGVTEMHGPYDMLLTIAPAR